MEPNLIVKLADGSERSCGKGIAVATLADDISPALRKSAVAARVDGRLVDLGHALLGDCALEFVPLDSEAGLAIYRRSAALLAAQAVQRVLGADRVRLGECRETEDGFSCDVQADEPLTPAVLRAVEKEMDAIARANLPVVRRLLGRDEAIAWFGRRGEPFLLERLRELPAGADVAVYEQGEFAAMCDGPLLPSTGRIKAFKLLGVSGAYWRGDADGAVLQRVHGAAFLKKSQLDRHLALLEEAKKRDHRKLGRELELFMFSEEAPGMPFYLPKGMAVRAALERFSRSFWRKRGYEEVRTPSMMNRRLWEQSGHWDHYKDHIYFAKVDDAEYALKPMNCPGHILLYNHRRRSYRELPIRYAEFGQVHRHEYSGALNGMMRVRAFCQDDAHLFVRPDQLEREIDGILALIDEMYAAFGFAYRIELSTKPESAMGSAELWERAERALEQSLRRRGAEYRLNPGDGAFYGPKIDFHIRDAIGRSWQCATVQLDFQMPEKFDLSYIGEDGGKHRPVLVHRAVFGSVDRFVGILTEHYAGAFPLWLAPVQAAVIPVSEADAESALALREALEEAGLRAEADLRQEKLGYKVREAQLAKVPYTLVLGEAERAGGTVSVRRRGEVAAAAMTPAELIARLRAEEAARA
ncbi:threonine--tRNA ligase [Paenibacillus sp. MWE-103]|uniref:Threonine--tRNA ligase n=1 Tax=Paenibacillus artemisiicola TaxID=1172618 RepID=A0ABS3W9H8_9BACL|nr:threonine--tRNA ligase [Paenibacillus artemisiicola]MBO7744948.1 threonine--tRNA ligase [Paenibacillus artemisiicola]